MTIDAGRSEVFGLLGKRGVDLLDSVKLSTEPDLRAKFQRAQELWQNDRAREALPIYEELADAGLVLAMRALAIIYMNGFHGSFFDKLIGRLTPERDKGYKHLRDAAEHGDPQAQVTLALAYFEGDEIIQKDYALAFKWACQAVDNPHATVSKTYACSLLAELYGNGIGCEKDLRQATLLRHLAKSWRHKIGGVIRPKNFHYLTDLEQWAEEVSHSYFRYFDRSAPKISTPESEFIQSCRVSDVG